MPPFFVFSAVALFALTVVAVGVHISMGNFADYEGITLLQEELVVRSSLAQVPSSTRSMRLQGLAEGEDEEAEKDKEDEEEVIRFENDKKVGGGDLMVPISMVDYENLGEGSIVDQVRFVSLSVARPPVPLFPDTYHADTTRWPADSPAFASGVCSGTPANCLVQMSSRPSGTRYGIGTGGVMTALRGFRGVMTKEQQHRRLRHRSRLSSPRQRGTASWKTWE